MPKTAASSGWVRPKLIVDADLADLNTTLQPVPQVRAMQLDFGKAITVAAIQPPNALRLARDFRRVIRARYGRLHYDSSILPLLVFADDDEHRVIVRFHSKVAVLQAKPEVFLAWADRLRDVVMALPAPLGA